MGGEPKLRLFTGIAIDPKVAENIEKALRAIRPLANLNWIPAANFHITLKFIGAWPERRLDELVSALRSTDPPAAFEIAICGFGLFPDPRRARFMFAGVRKNPALAELHTSMEAGLAPLGCPREEREYTPHLTLARIRNENIGELKKRIQSMPDIDFGSFQAVEFHLFRSVTLPQGSVYSRVAAFPLGRAK